MAKLLSTAALDELNVAISSHKATVKENTTVVKAPPAIIAGEMPTCSLWMGTQLQVASIHIKIMSLRKSPKANLMGQNWLLVFSMGLFVC